MYAHVCVVISCYIAFAELKNKNDLIAYKKKSLRNHKKKIHNVSILFSFVHLIVVKLQLFVTPIKLTMSNCILIKLQSVKKKCRLNGRNLR